MGGARRQGWGEAGWRWAGPGKPRVGQPLVTSSPTLGSLYAGLSPPPTTRSWTRTESCLLHAKVQSSDSKGAHPTTSPSDSRSLCDRRPHTQIPHGPYKNPSYLPYGVLRESNRVTRKRALSSYLRIALVRMLFQITEPSSLEHFLTKIMGCKIRPLL